MGALCAVMVLAACAPIPAGPHSSMAPFVSVEAPAEEKGKVSAAAMVTVSRDIDLYGPHGAGSLSLWLGDRYSLALMANMASISAEGAFRLWEGERGAVRLVHGLGAIPTVDRDVFYLAGMTTAGLFWQRSSSKARPSVYFGGVRGVLLVDDQGVADLFADLAAGWMVRRGGLQMGPEVILNPQVARRGSPTASVSFRLEGTF